MKKAIFRTLEKLYNEKVEIFEGEVITKIRGEYGIACFETEKEGIPARIGFVGCIYRPGEYAKEMQEAAASAVLEMSIPPSRKQELIADILELGEEKLFVFTLPFSGEKEADEQTRERLEKFLKHVYKKTMKVATDQAIERVEEIILDEYGDNPALANLARMKTIEKLSQKVTAEAETVDSGIEVVILPTTLERRLS